MPLRQLLVKILFIVETAHLEGRRLYETHQVLHAAFFLRPIWPAQLHPHAHFQHGVGEYRIPFRHLPVLLPLSAIVLGRSNTHCNGSPPQLCRCSARVRTKLSAVSSCTTLTRMKREYFSREAKKWIRRLEPSRNSISICPKSC